MPRAPRLLAHFNFTLNWTSKRCLISAYLRQPAALRYAHLSLSLSRFVCLPLQHYAWQSSYHPPPSFRSRKELVSEKWWVIQCWYWRGEWWYSRPTDPPPAWNAVTAVQRASRQRRFREERWQRLSLSHARSLLIWSVYSIVCANTHMHNSAVPKPSELPIWLMFFFSFCLYIFFNQSIN